MTSPECPLCHTRQSAGVFEERGFRVHACGCCDLFFIDPYPHVGAKVHDAVRKNEYDELRVIDVERQYRSEVAFYGQHFPSIERELKDARAALDVGCGTGRLLELLGRSRPSMRRAGIELNTRRAERARTVADCPVHQVPIEEFRTDDRFDVITMMNVLSHIPSLDALFASVRALLADGGRLILKSGEVRRDAKKRDVHDWGIPGHMHFLGFRTMDYIARKYRFRVARHDRVPLSAELFAPACWDAEGRSALRNAVKRLVRRVPFGLSGLALAYDLLRGKRIMTSLFVLVPETSLEVPSGTGSV